MTTQSDLVLHASPSKARNITLWVVQGLLAAAFLMAGGSKLVGDGKMVEMFQQIGFGQWFRYLTGAIEVAGAIMLLIPRTAVIGGALLAVTMIAGIGTHLFLIGGSPAPAVVLLALASIVVWYRGAAF
jgi:putative oxidoreductase